MDESCFSRIAHVLNICKTKALPECYTLPFLVVVFKGVGVPLFLTLLYVSADWMLYNS